MSEPTQHEKEESVNKEQIPEEQGANQTLSPVLARLIDEVRNEQSDSPRGYNRMHNRHNRSR